MPIPRRTTNEGTFFVTTITYNRRRLFQVPANAELFLETLQHYRAEGTYKLHAFVVMPDHAHLLLTPNDKTISQVMNLIKGGFSRRVASKFPIWQRGFADHLVLDRAQFESRRDYIHQTPSAPTSSLPPKSTPIPPHTAQQSRSKEGREGTPGGTRKRVPFRTHPSNSPPTADTSSETPD
jgi:putative transposase